MDFLWLGKPETLTYSQVIRVAESNGEVTWKQKGQGHGKI